MKQLDEKLEKEAAEKKEMEENFSKERADFEK